MNIYWSTKENAHLSNLAPRPFSHNGHSYKSVEHAYQTLKSGVFDSSAYERGKHVAKAPGFLGVKTEDNYNINLMYTLMCASFQQNKDAATWLKLTYPQELTHNQDTTIWRTTFPQLLTRIREELINGKHKEVHVKPKPTAD